MRDPHVEDVHYDIGTGDGLSFSNPPPLVITNHLGRFELTDGKLTIYPADHFADGAQARVVLEPFLRAWEVESDLSRNIGSIRFNYTHVRKVDRNPPLTSESGAAHLSVQTGDVILMSDALSCHITRALILLRPPISERRQRWRSRTADGSRFVKGESRCRRWSMLSLPCSKEWPETGAKRPQHFKSMTWS